VASPSPSFLCLRAVAVACVTMTALNEPINTDNRSVHQAQGNFSSFYAAFPKTRIPPKSNITWGLIPTSPIEWDDPLPNWESVRSCNVIVLESKPYPSRSLRRCCVVIGTMVTIASSIETENDVYCPFRLSFDIFGVIREGGGPSYSCWTIAIPTVIAQA
jgi:hypothetical protein